MWGGGVVANREPGSYIHIHIYIYNIYDHDMIMIDPSSLSMEDMQKLHF